MRIKSNKWVNIFIENPFKTWWKARKYFKIPKIRISFYKNYFKAKRPILEIRCMDIMWKDKFNSPRHEYNPHISILLFNKFGFILEPRIYYKNEFGERRFGDSMYWEYILDYLYYGKSLLCYSNWITDSKLYKERIYGKEEDGTEDTFKPMYYAIPTVAMSLNKRGIKKLKEELNEQGRNTK